MWDCPAVAERVDVMVVTWAESTVEHLADSMVGLLEVLRVSSVVAVLVATWADVLVLQKVAYLARRTDWSRADSTEPRMVESRVDVWG